MGRTLLSNKFVAPSPPPAPPPHPLPAALRRHKPFTLAELAAEDDGFPAGRRNLRTGALQFMWDAFVDCAPRLSPAHLAYEMEDEEDDACGEEDEEDAEGELFPEAWTIIRNGMEVPGDDEDDEPEEDRESHRDARPLSPSLELPTHPPLERILRQSRMLALRPPRPAALTDREAATRWYPAPPPPASLAEMLTRVRGNRRRPMRRRVEEALMGGPTDAAEPDEEDEHVRSGQRIETSPSQFVWREDDRVRLGVLQVEIGDEEEEEVQDGEEREEEARPSLNRFRAGR